MVKRWTILMAAGGAVALAAVPAAGAADVQATVSQNWSGYVAGAQSGSTQFSSVSGSWVQPSARCDAGDGYAAFWVGLGGSSNQSGSLEQVGTQADCSSGQPINYAWYELVPAAPVKLGLAIHPGDHIAARVSVSGNNVTVAISDQTTGDSATKTLQMDNPDTSSAEWIAEAPSSCGQDGGCQPLPLADFGSVTFTNASATANGHTGPISDPDWSAQAVQLSGSGAGARFAATDSGAGAAPSSLSTDGSSFSVAWQSADTSTSASGDPGYGYGYGGYGGGDGYGGGYPGYGGYGYGGYGGYGGGGYTYSF
jgi:Peptidase A4 family